MISLSMRKPPSYAYYSCGEFTKASRDLRSFCPPGTVICIATCPGATECLLPTAEAPFRGDNSALKDISSH